MKNEIKNTLKIIVLLIVVFVVLYFLHITIGERFEDQYKSQYEMGETSIIFSMDSINKTLTVQEIYSNGRTLQWPEVIISKGSATLPDGTIDVGDKITDCKGNLVLKWEDTGILIFSTYFS
jgi:hypothetical protein